MSRDGQPNRPHGFWHKHGVKLVISMLIAVAFTWTLERGGLPLLPPASAFRKVELASCLEYLGLLACVHAVRATRWRHLLAPIADVPCAVSSPCRG